MVCSPHPFAILLPMTPPFKLAPSVLAADFTRLGEQVREVEAAGADLIHVDVMDGQFVPNISFGSLVIGACKRVTDLPLDVHLMIVQPERFLAEVVAAGASTVTVHAEATPHVHRALQMIRQEGARAGLVVNPLTPLNVVKDALPYLDQVLIMSVNPGFGGQSFIEGSLNRLQTVRTWIGEGSFEVDLEVDGGVGTDNIDTVVAAGANVIVAGSAVFGGGSVAENIKALREAAILGAASEA